MGDNNLSNSNYMEKLQKLEKEYLKKNPKKKILYGGDFTKDFRRFNKDLLKQGKTDIVIDNFKYNKKTKKFSRFSDRNLSYYDKDNNEIVRNNFLFTQKGQQRKNQLDKEIKGDIFFDSEKKYLDNILDRFNTKENKIKKDKEFNIKRDKFVGNKFNTNKILKFVDKIDKVNNKVIFYSKDKDGNRYNVKTLTAKTISNIQKLGLNKIRKLPITGSDVEDLFELIENDENIYFKFLNPETKYIKKTGKFFPYTHKLDKIDLSRYGIFQEVKKKHYKLNCFLYSLEIAGINTDKIKSMVVHQSIPRTKLKEVAKELNIYISVKTLRNVFNKKKNKKEITTEKKYYGDKNNKLIELGILKEHYFLIEKLEYTKYSIENYFDIYDIDDYNLFYDDKFRKRTDRFIDSFTLIRILLDNQNKFLEPINKSDELYKTIYYNKIENFGSLEYENHNVDINKPSKGMRDPDFIYFFDFETITKDKNNKNICNKPYCVYTDKHPDGFWGEECGKDLLYNLLNNHGVKRTSDNPFKQDNIPEIRLIAHNATYDYRFLSKYGCGFKILEKGSSVINFTFYFMSQYKIIRIFIIDSLKMINLPLRKFGGVFDLDQEKEIMPYDLYNEENVKKKYINIDECLKFVKQTDREQYLYNCERWECINDNKIDILKYAGKYCYLDCVVLKQGYEKFDELSYEAIKEHSNKYYTLASLADNYLKIKGCYDDVLKISGVPRDFIQKCVVGGRCMVKNNKPTRRDIDYADLDKISLYPASMYRLTNELGGFLKGSPKVIKNFEPQKYDGYFIKIKVLKVGKRLNFPLQSILTDKGIREFTNDLVGKELYIDKIALEDFVKFQKVEYKFIQGYYYDEGRNDEIGKVILDIFNNRKKYKNIIYVKDENNETICEYPNKKEFEKSIHKDYKFEKGNPLQLIFKELMNSAYGKSILKPIDTECIIKYEGKLDDYINRNFDFIKSADNIGGTPFYKVKLEKAINKHYNNVHVGVEILSMSKRIMNEVMCLAEDLNIDMTYQDTDSIHLPLKDVKRLEYGFKKLYHRELQGEIFGNFHVDFEMDGAKGDIKSIKSIFLGKKCYIDKLQSINDEGLNIFDYHIRMKGVSNDCILYKADTEYNGDIFRIYEDLLNGEYTGSGDKEKNKDGLLFNLTAVNPKFEYKKNQSVICKDEFNRLIKWYDYDNEDLNFYEEEY